MHQGILKLVILLLHGILKFNILLLNCTLKLVVLSLHSFLNLVCLRTLQLYFQFFYLVLKSRIRTRSLFLDFELIQVIKRGSLSTLRGLVLLLELRFVQALDLIDFRLKVSQERLYSHLKFLVSLAVIDFNGLEKLNCVVILLFHVRLEQLDAVQRPRRERHLLFVKIFDDVLYGHNEWMAIIMCF